MGLDEPLYYHEAGWEPGREARKQS